jgi:hypothetical protein
MGGINSGGRALTTGRLGLLALTRSYPRPPPRLLHYNSNTSRSPPPPALPRLFASSSHSSRPPPTALLPIFRHQLQRCRAPIQVILLLAHRVRRCPAPVRRPPWPFWCIRRKRSSRISRPTSTTSLSRVKSVVERGRPLSPPAAWACLADVGVLPLVNPDTSLSRHLSC